MISVQGLYDDCAQDFGLGSGNTRFSNTFIRCVNRALDDLAVSTDESKLTPVTSTTDTINLDQHYEYIVFAGAKYYLIRSGFRPSDPKIATAVYQDTAAAWLSGKADFSQDRDNIAMSDPTLNIVANGSVVTTP